MLVSSIAHSVAEEARISLMEDIDDTIAVNISPALTDLTAARGAGLYVLCYGLPADGAKFHRGVFPLKNKSLRKDTAVFWKLLFGHPLEMQSHDLILEGLSWTLNVP
jgi:hypothetical protein